MYIKRLGLFILVAFLSACSAETKNYPETQLLPHENALVFKAELQTELNSNPDSIGFGEFLRLDMNGKGEFYITDGLNKTIHRFNKKGEEISIFQGSGRGPGEFMSMILVLEDQLGLVGIYDPMQRRITIMDADLEQVKKTIQVKSPPEIGIILFGFNEQGALYAGFKGFTLFNSDEQRELHIYFQEFEKEEVELIFTLPTDDWLPIINQQNRSVFLYYKPFGRRVSLTKFNDQLIYISNDGFGYTVYDLNGTSVYSDSLYPGFGAYSLNDRQIEQHVVSQISPDLAANQKNESLSNLRSAVNPKTRVRFQNSFVDVQGRLWFELYPELFDGVTRWIVWDRTRDEVFQVVFDEEGVRPQNAIDETVMAFKRNEFDLETIRIYTLRR